MSTQHNDSNNGIACTSNVNIAELTLFQLNALRTIEKLGAPSGLAVKRDLEDYHGNTINHGRLYPSLNKLVRVSLVEKGSKDDRTNEYTLTEDGKNALIHRRRWMRPDSDGNGGVGE